MAYIISRTLPEWKSSKPPFSLAKYRLCLAMRNTASFNWLFYPSLIWVQSYPVVVGYEKSVDQGRGMESEVVFE
jgi:hypothetical protein